VWRPSPQESADRRWPASTTVPSSRPRCGPARAGIGPGDSGMGSWSLDAIASPKPEKVCDVAWYRARGRHSAGENDLVCSAVRGLMLGLGNRECRQSFAPTSMRRYDAYMCRGAARSSHVSKRPGATFTRDKRTLTNTSSGCQAAQNAPSPAGVPEMTCPGTKSPSSGGAQGAGMGGGAAIGVTLSPRSTSLPSCPL